MKTKTFKLISLLAMGCLILAGCNNTTPENSKENPEKNVKIENPASIYCEDNWWTLQIETDNEWNQNGICMFSDGTYCEEWSYFRDECQPGEIIYNTISGEEIVTDNKNIAEEEISEGEL